MATELHEQGVTSSWFPAASRLVLSPPCADVRCPCRNGYQKFSQEMLSNGELNHLPMKERMAEIGGRWQRLVQKEKDQYKKIAEEKQRQYKVLLEQWLAVRNSKNILNIINFN